jgi:hypothetical protein
MRPLPLDPGLNAAILQIAPRVLPRGFDVAVDAPSTYAELRQLIATGTRLRIWTGACQHTIYADPAVNHAFRAWHDWSHWIADEPFTPKGERAVAALQCRQLVADYGDNARTRRWQAIIGAEVIGQNEYRRRHRRFPADQIGFVRAYLDDRPYALNRPDW